MPVNTIFYKTSNKIFHKTALAAALAAFTSLSHAAVIEEVIVTAQKRAESLQDVPISVDVLQADALRARSINNAQDLAIATPSVVFQKGGMPFANNFVIRGIGSMGIEGGIQPSVSFVVDGVPLSRISEFSADLGDIERIEILRGPQGTLYGRNATGGVVNIVRAAPTSETEGYVQQSLSDDEEYTTRLMYNTALSDKIYLRLSGMYTNRDDYIENVIDGNPDLGGEETMGVMGKLAINFNDSTELLVTADYRKVRSSEGAQHVDAVESGSGVDPVSGLTYDTIGAIRLRSLGGGNAALGQEVVDDPFKTSQDHDQQANMESYGISFDLTKEFSDELTLKSITAYRSSSSYSSIDVDNTPANATQTYGLGLVAMIDTNVSTRPHDELIANEIEYFSQELRFEGSTDKLDWIAGAYYSHMEEVADNIAPTSLFNNAVYRADPKEATATWNSYAAFGDVTFHVSDTFDIFAGLRWTQEDMNIKYWNQVYQVPLAFVTPGAIDFGVEYTYLDLSDPSVAAVLAGGGLTTTEFERDDTSADWSGRAGFSWDFSDSAQLYATASRGFVGAGANIGRSANASNAVVNPSTTTAYEIGLKSQLFNNSVQLNGAVFRQEVVDLQTSRVVPGSINTETFNAGTLTTQGIEGSLDWAATDILMLSASVSYLDTEIDDLIQPCYPGQTASQGCNVDNGGVFVQDVSGSQMVLAPELSYNVQARMNIPLESAPLNLFAQVSYTWQDDTSLTLDYDPALTQESYGLTDVSLGIEDQAGYWSVMLFGKNITDEYFASSLSASNGYAGQGRVQSRTTRGAQAYWGVTAKYNF
ncbi:TonB-dependent receptor [Aestuariicella hydrocarbonica]|uniref:TonB-dependent receptor n=1 Tax=Pseudomaricurvus hydrocarbonicus TaxID=1470433 RepID=A0A9E5K0W3_9GAMM|nr:TonB-dependent receptor [Aestuariicella hydrocarbonica]NHO66662.1 TonB-dependent receptor [Aestuariicella hydrocarbonica]